MSLSISYFKLYFLNTLRNPPSLFFTLIFPPLMLLITAHQWGGARTQQLEALIVFLNYSVQTVSFMLLGMGVSQEKNSAWSDYLRTLPAPVSTMVLGRALHTLFLCVLNLIILSLVAVYILAIPVTLNELSYFFCIALLGGIPMALMGMTIGYASSPESSRSIFTLLNLLLLFGAFSLPDHGFLSYIREAVPTYQWKLLSLKVIYRDINVVNPLIWFGIYSVVFLYLFQKTYFKDKRN